MTDEHVHVTEPRLNLGSGGDYREGWHNVDIAPDHNPDEVRDLEETPWPWEDDAFEEILLDNVLEHIDPHERVPLLKECRRVLSMGGEMTVRLPTRTGWDVTHYAVPSYTWPNHPTNDGDWEIVEVSGERIGPGRLMPESVALFCTRYDVVRCLRQVEVVVR
jgi:predicted SAM-dependent methyltransferase